MMQRSFFLHLMLKQHKMNLSYNAGVATGLKAGSTAHFSASNISIAEPSHITCMNSMCLCRVFPL